MANGEEAAFTVCHRTESDEWKIELLKTEQDRSRAIQFVSGKDDTLFLQSNMENEGVVDHGKRFQGTYVVAVAKGVIEAIFCHCWNGMLLVSLNKAVPSDVVGASFQFLLQHSPVDRVLIGLMGEKQSVASVMAVADLSSIPLTNQTSSSEVMLRCHVKDVIPHPLALRAQRPAVSEIDELTRWMVSFTEEALGTTGLDWEAEKLAMTDVVVKGRSLWVLRLGNTNVAMARVNASSQGRVMIGGVYTPKEHRRKGYAKAVVSGMLQSLKEEDESMHTALLFTENQYALRAYRSIGFKDTGEYSLRLFADPVSKLKLLRRLKV